MHGKRKRRFSLPSSIGMWVALLQALSIEQVETGGGCIHWRYPNLVATLQKDCKICNHVFTTETLILPPYSGAKFQTLMKSVIESCCEACPGFQQQFLSPRFWLTERGLETVLLQSDFVYPVFSYSKSVEVFGNYYIPFYDPAGAVLITEKEEFRIGQLVLACTKLWSLLVVCFLMAVIAGFVAWLLEARNNLEDFPHRGFIRGWMEGIWLSFISMTGVGYGDKSPKNIIARVFAIAWFVAGTMAFGILTGSLTTIIMEGSSQTTPTIAGGKIGVLGNRIYDSNLVAQHGGRIVKANGCLQTKQAIFSLVHKLLEREIDGFLLDKYTYWNWKANDMKFSWQLDTSLNQTYLLKKCAEKLKAIQRHRYACYDVDCVDHLVHFMTTRTTETDIPHSGDEVAYGILVRNKEHYEYFKNAFLNNRMMFKTELSDAYAANTGGPREKEISFKLYEMENQMDVFLVLAAMLGAILLYGCVRKVWRKLYARLKMERSNDTIILPS